MDVERRLEGRDQLLKLVKGHAGHIQERCGAGLHVGEPDTGHLWCLLSIETQHTINRDKLNCGEGKHLVSMSCKSSLCLRCAKVYVDDWVAQVGKMLHEGVIYRHIVLTVPDVLRTPFYQNADVLLSPFMKCGVKCLDDFFSTVSGKALKGGYIVVIQTHGRNGQYNPHLHIISTSGGWDEQAQKWVHVSYLPYPMLHKKWRKRSRGKLIENQWVNFLGFAHRFC